MSERIRLVVGDISLLKVDVIVTAANTAMMGSGGVDAGVDGAVHRTGGPELTEATQQLGYCPEGEARITPGFALPAKWVIHAVGPIYVNGQSGEAETLTATYRAALTLAEEQGAETIAFPCISTGAFRFPNEEACTIAIGTVKAWLSKHELPHTVIFCCYEPPDALLYQEQLGMTAEPVTPDK